MTWNDGAIYTDRHRQDACTSLFAVSQTRHSDDRPVMIIKDIPDSRHRH